MDRTSMRYRTLAAFALALTSLLPTVGCRGLLTTAMYFIKGTDVEPEFAELKGKKVAVVCRPLASLQYANATVSRDLAEQVTRLLQDRVPKIRTVEQRKVVKWTDENTWEEFTEVGKALKADMVVGIELENFSLFQGQTLYQGKANATVYVYDCKKGGKQVFEKHVPQSVYPPNASIPTSERTEAEFRREFVAVLADQVARYFFSHDPYSDVGRDADSLR
jgi:hypothetical protein